MSKYTSFTLALSQEQSEAMQDTLNAIGPGESVIAQVYGDGMRVKLLTKEQTDAVRNVTGAEGLKAQFNSAFECQRNAQGRLQ